MYYLRFLAPVLLTASVAALPASAYAGTISAASAAAAISAAQQQVAAASAAASASTASLLARQQAMLAAMQATHTTGAAAASSASASAGSGSAAAVSAAVSASLGRAHFDHDSHRGAHLTASASGAAAASSASASASASASTSIFGKHFHKHTHRHTRSDSALSLEKTDNRSHDLTRRRHTFTYTLTVENTGHNDIHDLKITDAIPGAFTIESVSGDGKIDGQTVRWTNVILEAGEKKSFTIMVRVDHDAPLTEVCNTASAKSEDHGLSVSDGDCITVARQSEVKGVTAKKTVVTPVLVQPMAQPKPVSTVSGIPVPITAKTGAGILGIGSAAALLGALGLYRRQRMIG